MSRTIVTAGRERQSGGGIVAHGQGHSVDEYLETIYFLAFPIGEYRPATGVERDRLARRRDARRLARLGRRDAEAARGRGARRAGRAQGGDPDADRHRAGRARRPQAPPDRALPHRLHGLHAAESHVHADELGDTFSDDMVERIERAARPSRPLPARLADRDRRRAGRERRARRRSPTSRPGGSAEIVRLAEHDGELLRLVLRQRLRARARWSSAATRRRTGRSRSSSTAPRARSTRRSRRACTCGLLPRRPERARRQTDAGVARPAAARSASALSVRSHVKPASSRPKWPYEAVLW